VTSLTDDIRQIVREECARLGDRIVGGKPTMPPLDPVQDAAMRALDRRRATLRRTIMATAILAALVAWGIVGFGFFLAWLMR
jgi:hypothetical protein